MSSNTCLCIDLRSAAQKLTQRYDEAMVPSGISVTQFSQLHLIRSLDGPTLKALSAASDLDRSTLGRNIRVMEKLGLVRMKVGADARTRSIHLTRKGANAYKRAIPLWHSVQSQLLSRLGDRSQLDELLATLSAPLTEPLTTDDETGKSL